VNAQLPPVLAAALAPFAPPSSEVHRIAEADQHYNELKNSGELERRRIETAIRNERVHPWEITL
jgi:hypothetical protein